MKCCAPLTITTKRLSPCGQEARFQLNGRPLCRRHASEQLFRKVLGEPELCKFLDMERLND